MTQIRDDSPPASLDDAGIVFGAFDDAVVVVDRFWTCMYANATAAELFQRPAQGLLRRDLRVLLGEAPSAPLWREARSAIEEQRPRRLDAYFESLDRWFSVILAPYGGGLAMILRDITARRRSAVLQQLPWQFLDALSEAAVVTDLSCIVVQWNRAAEALYGWRASEVLGRDVREVIPQELSDERRAAVHTFLAAGQAWVGEVRQVDRRGAKFLAKATILPVVDAEGSLAGIATIVTNLDARNAEGVREAWLSAALESSSDAIIRRDLDGRITFWNQGAEDLYGYTADEVLGERYSMLAPPDREKDLEQFVARLHAGEILPAFEGRRRFKDGSVHTVAISATPEHDSAGAIVGSVTIARDVTSTKETERQLARAMRVMARVSDAIVAADADGRVTYWNEAAERISGLRAEDIVGRHVSESYAAQWLRPEDAAASEESLSQTGSWHGESAVELRSGQRLFLESSVSRLTEAEGAPGGWVAVVRDITERKRAEQELAASEARFQALLHSPIVGIVTADRSKILTANDEFLRMTGYSREELDAGALDWVTMTPPEYADGDQERVREVVRHGFCMPYEKDMFRRDGTRVPVSVGVALLPGEKPEGVICVVLDLTERKLLEAERNRVVSGIVHDLRTPLTVIQGLTEVLQREVERPKAVDSAVLSDGLQRIHLRSRVANALLGDLLDSARLRSGRPLALLQAPCDLVSLVQSVADDQQQLTNRHNIVVNRDDPQLLGHWDGPRLERVFANLLSNAVKYSPEEGVILIRIARELVGGRAWAVVSVQDYGIGIAAADLPHVFDRWHRGYNTAGIHGNGLGLDGVKQIVEQHGGAVAVTSAEGQGSTFTVRLPI